MTGTAIAEQSDERTKRIKRRWGKLIVLGVILAGLATAVVFAVIVVGVLRPGRPLTDEQKRQRIEKLYAEYRASFPDAAEMTVAQLLVEKKTGKVVLVDVREPAEQEVSMIPGAIPARQFEQEDKWREAKQIVVYCTIGYRSGLYAEKLGEQGYRAVNLKGGILAWVHAGQMIVNRNGMTTRMHVYHRKWNLLPREYEATW